MSKKLSSQVYEYLQQQIFLGNLLPGAVLDLNQISRELNISRSPLRDALIRLETEGFLTIHPRSKVVMNKLELSDIQYLYEILSSFESTLILRGMDTYTPEIIKHMYTLNDNMRKALSDNQLPLYDVEHRKFHEVFLERAPNKFVERILQPIKARLWDLPRKNFCMEWMFMACDEHHNIIQAIEKKDTERLIFEVKKRHWDFAYNEKYIQSTYF